MRDASLSISALSLWISTLRSFAQSMPVLVSRLWSIQNLPKAYSDDMQDRGVSLHNRLIFPKSPFVTSLCLETLCTCGTLVRESGNWCDGKCQRTIRFNRSTSIFRLHYCHLFLRRHGFEVPRHGRILMDHGVFFARKSHAYLYKGVHSRIGRARSTSTCFSSETKRFHFHALCVVLCTCVRLAIHAVNGGHVRHTLSRIDVSPPPHDALIVPLSIFIRCMFVVVSSSWCSALGNHGRAVSSMDGLFCWGVTTKPFGIRSTCVETTVHATRPNRKRRHRTRLEHVRT